MKKSLICLLLILGMALLGQSFAIEEPIESFAERGRILEVVSGEYAEGSFLKTDIVTLEILTGELKGEIRTIEHTLTDNYAYDLEVEPGDKVLLLIERYEEEGQEAYQVYISEYVRDTYVYWVIGAFMLLLLIIGKKTGLKTLISLIITVVLILKVLLPGILKGYSPIPLTIGVAFCSTLITLLLISGFKPKTYAAIIGVLGGIMAAGVITFYVGSKVKLTGLSGEEVGMLMFIPQNIDFDFRGLLFSGIMLGSMGAVMDVGISVASSMEEVKRVHPEITPKELFLSGMNVGRDMMGTMSNTLILAYTGSTIPMLLLFMAYETDLTKIINLDIIASEIIRAVAGTIGLILTIPLTALAASMLYDKNRAKKEEAVKRG